MLQVLNMILTQTVKTSRLYITLGRSFFSTRGTVVDLGFGKVVRPKFGYIFPRDAPIDI
jgi:hypothetical protein